MSAFSAIGGWAIRLISRWRSSSELRLSTSLSPDEVLNRMRRASLEPAFFRMTGPPHSVVGRFQARRFSLIAAQAIRHNQARYFFGEVVQADGRTVVQGRFQRRLPLRIAESIILSIVILAGLSTSIRTGDPKPLLIALLVIAAISFLDRYQMLRSAPYEDDVRTFLTATLHETP